MELEEYIPALITGLIGLFGVILGGLLQVGAQRRRDREQMRYEMRKKTATLVTTAMLFASGIAQLVREVNMANELHANASPQDAQRLKDRREHINAIVDAVQAHSRDLQFFTIELMSWSEQKIARQALILQKLCTAADNATSPITRHEKTVTNEEGMAWQDRISDEANVLRLMVAPRKFERICRFRRYKRAKKLLSKTDR